MNADKRRNGEILSYAFIPVQLRLTPALSNP